MSALLALAASLMWGVSDFVGGSASRRMSTVQVLLASQLVTLPVVLAVFLLGDGWHGSLVGVGWAAAAGAAGIVGLAALYKALASGRMGVVAPISSCGAAAPVVVGLLTGERVPAVALVGMACVLVGLVACARPVTADDEGTRTSWRPIALALVSAIAFGAVLICLAHAGRTSASMSLLVMRCASLALVAAVAVHRRVPLPRPTLQPSLVAIGLLDLAANGSYALAGAHGELAVVGVLGSLYPAVPVLLARQLHGERLGSARGVGVVATLAGVVLLGATQVAG